MAVPGDEPQWMLLARPATERDLDAVRGFCRAGVTVLRNDARIELPPTRVPGGELRWVSAPSCDRHPVPPFAELAATILN